MKKLVIVAGIPGSGKSTYLNEHYKDENSFHFDSDETRKKMYGTYLHFPKDMYEIYNVMINDANLKYGELVEEGKNDFTFLMDSTFLDNYRRLYYVKHLKKFDYYELLMFKTNDINFNLINNKKRIKDKWVPEDVILKMVDQYEEPNEEVKNIFNEIKIIKVG